MAEKNKVVQGVLEAPEVREIRVWQPPEPPADRLIKDAERDARIAVAENRKIHAEMQRVGMSFVLSQMQKWARMAASPDFANSPGPIEPVVVLKMAEFLSKNYRLDTGQSTENVAHAVKTSVDFSKLSQAERDAWRALALKGGGSGE